MTDPLNQFMNIWEIERNFKCPVVGAMLSVEKHKSILKKCGWDVKILKPYEYHSHLMGCMGDENAVSIKVNNYIRHQARKYMVEIAALYEAGDGDGVRNLWEQYCAQGVIGPVMYAIVAHRDADIELLQDVHGEVHMLAHANMTEVFDVRKKLEAADQTLSKEKRNVSEKNSRIKELVREVKEANQEKNKLADENCRLKKRIKEIEELLVPENQGVTVFENRIYDLEQALENEKEEVRQVDRERKQLEIDLFSARNENTLLQDEIMAFTATFSGGDFSVAETSKEAIACPVQSGCVGDACPNYRLCAKRVFMIGGITKMKAYYRDIVENAGGVFDYHDGYLKNSNANLAARVKRCDVVVCPVNCNSHNACLKVKQLCNRYNKELKILNSASLSAVTQALMVPETASVN